MKATQVSYSLTDATPQSVIFISAEQTRMANETAASFIKNGYVNVSISKVNTMQRDWDSTRNQDAAGLVKTAKLAAVTISVLLTYLFSYIHRIF